LKLTDTHCHLNLDQFDADLPEVLDRAVQAGIERIIVPGIDLETSQKAIELAETYPQIYAAVGMHPTEAGQWTEAADKKIRRIAEHPRVAAIGEIGLDYHWDHGNKAAQVAALQAQLEIAQEMGLPVILHNRKSSDDLYALLLDWQENLSEEKNGLAERPGVLHAYQENHPLTDALVRANFLFGIGGPVTFTNDKSLSQIAETLPLENVVLETDAPFLTPHPYRGKRNEPAYIRLVAEKIAAIRCRDLTDIAQSTSDNAARLFWGDEHIE